MANTPHPHPSTASLLISGLPRHSADLGPTGQAAVEETGSATFLAARVAQVRSQSQTVGAALTNAAIKGVLTIYYQTYWYFRVQLI